MTIPEQPAETSGHLRRAQHRQALRALRRARHVAPVDPLYRVDAGTPRTDRMSPEQFKHTLVAHGRRCSASVGAYLVAVCECHRVAGPVCECGEVLAVSYDVLPRVAGVECDHRSLLPVTLAS